MPLAHTIEVDPAREPSRSLWLLHGVLGSRRNWRAFGRRLAALAPGVRVVTVDLRGHGESRDLGRAARPGAVPPAPGSGAAAGAAYSLATCADDLIELGARLGSPEVVCGHSFGGKVALSYALRRPPSLRQVWMLDSPPGPGESVPGELAALLALLEALPMPVGDRRTVRDHLLGAGCSHRIADWMTTNLVPEPGGGLRWRFSLPAVRELLADYFATDLWPALADPTLPVTRRLLRGERSDRFTGPDIDRLERLARAGACTVDVLPGAGHWVHVDKGDALLQWMLRYLQSTAPAPPEPRPR